MHDALNKKQPISYAIAMTSLLVPFEVRMTMNHMIQTLPLQTDFGQLQYPADSRANVAFHLRR